MPRALTTDSLYEWAAAQVTAQQREVARQHLQQCAAELERFEREKQALLSHVDR